MLQSCSYDLVAFVQIPEYMLRLYNIMFKSVWLSTVQYQDEGKLASSKKKLNRPFLPFLVNFPFLFSERSTCTTDSIKYYLEMVQCFLKWGCILYMEVNACL